jgi:hypothetical protein
MDVAQAGFDDRLRLIALVLGEAGKRKAQQYCHAQRLSHECLLGLQLYGCSWRLRFSTAAKTRGWLPPVSLCISSVDHPPGTRASAAPRFRET